MGTLVDQIVPILDIRILGTYSGVGRNLPGTGVAPFGSRSPRGLPMNFSNIKYSTAIRLIEQST